MRFIFIAWIKSSSIEFSYYNVVSSLYNNFTNINKGTTIFKKSTKHVVLWNFIVKDQCILKIRMTYNFPCSDFHVLFEFLSQRKIHSNSFTRNFVKNKNTRVHFFLHVPDLFKNIHNIFSHFFLLFILLFAWLYFTFPGALSLAHYK